MSQKCLQAWILALIVVAAFMTADKAARCILRGLKRRRRIIIFDWRFKLIVGLWRLIPRWLWERLTIVRN